MRRKGAVVEIGGDRNLIDFRFPVQYVNRPTHEFQGYCGQVQSGVVRKGDPVVVLPSGKSSRVDSNHLHGESTDTLQLNEIGRVNLECFRPLIYDESARNRATGSFIVIDPFSNVTVGAGMIIDAALILITSFISPYVEDREQARTVIGDEAFFEVFVDAPFAVCEERDPKGLYKKVRSGQIASFTGISAPSEAPESPALLLNTAEFSIEECVDPLLSALKERGVLGD